MRKIASAAAAVIMGACALTGSGGSAEAATVYNVSVSLLFSFEGFADAPAGSPDRIVGDSGSFFVTGSTRTTNLTSFGLVNKELSLGGGIDPFDNTLSLNGSIFASNVPVTGDVPGFAELSGQFFVFTSPLSADGTYFTYDDTGFGRYVFSVNNSLTFTGDVPGSVNAIVTIGPVPLPAAAPMFGAALLALGGLGYARRRVTLKPQA